MPPEPDVVLNKGVRIPQLRFGVFQIDDDELTPRSCPLSGRLPQHRHSRRLISWATPGPTACHSARASSAFFQHE
jgi:hypothetical protein